MIKVALAPQDIRFPKTEDHEPGEVKEYTMPLDEIRKKYGPPLHERVSKEELWELKKKGYDNKKIAQKLGIDPVQVKALFSYYRGYKERGYQIQAKNKEDEGEMEVAKANEEVVKELTKEKYLELKEKGETDFQIAKKIGLYTPKLTQLKKEWGLSGLKNKDVNNQNTPATIDTKSVELMDKIRQLEQELQREKEMNDKAESQINLLYAEVKLLREKNQKLEEQLKAEQEAPKVDELIKQIEDLKRQNEAYKSALKVAL